MAVQFLNVDLEIESPRPLCHVFTDFSYAEIHCLNYFETDRGHFANFEISSVRGDPNSIMADFCDAIEDFRDDARSVWTGAHRRTFDLGYESDASTGSTRSDLKADTLRRAAALGASVVITIYPMHLPELDSSRPEGS